MKKINIFILLCLITSLTVLYAQPSVTVVSVDNITATKAKFKGNIQNLGSRINEIQRRGFIFAPKSNYQAGDTTKYSEKAAKKNEMYSYEITQMSDYLKPNTTYWVKAFITLKKSSSDTEYVYSDKYEFTTAEPINDYATVSFAENITLNTASLKGSIDSMGNADILVDCGFVYSKSANPTLTSVGAIQTNCTFNPNKLYPKQITSDIIDLEASTTYFYRIWTINKYTATYVDTAYSEQKSFTTLHACGAVPKKLDTVYVHTNEVELSWEAQEGQTNFEVEYGFSGHKIGEGQIVAADANHVVLKDLESNRSYTSYVRAVCPDKKSEWSTMRPFHTLAAPCEKVMGLHLDHATHITAKIEWTAGQSGQDTWEVLFAKNGSSYPSTPFVVTGKPAYFPIGLTIDTEYKIKVRSVCKVYYDTIVVEGNPPDSVVKHLDSNIYSEWSDDLIFKTASSSLNEGMTIDYYVSVFPNPATNIINFKTQGNMQDIKKVEIYSTLGTLVYTSDVLPVQLSINSFDKGTYTIHITSPKGVQVEKIIIK